MTDPIETLLSRLDKVKQIKPDQWLAACPAHQDRNPSLSLSRGDDGRALLKCWSGCGAAEIVQAVGLTLADLFEGNDHQAPGRKRPIPNYKNILKLLRHEIEVLAIASSDLKYGVSLSVEDFQTVERTRKNILKVLRAANV